MIVRPYGHWLRRLFVWHGSVLQAILPQMAFMLLVSLLALRTDARLFGERAAASFTLVGVTLAVFLGFRNNVSHARYWEARMLWGQVYTASRTLLSQVGRYAGPDAQAERGLFLRHLIAFAYGLNRQLRGTPDATPLPGLRADEEAALAGKQFRPMAILDRLRETLARLRAEARIGALEAWSCDNMLVRLSEASGGCERIAATPFPYSYGVLLHRTVFAYSMLLPFGLAQTLGAATPFVSLFVAYTLLAMEEISSEIADPFGTSPNDLALDAICRNIERALLELEGQEPLPEPLSPDSTFILR